MLSTLNISIVLSFYILFAQFLAPPKFDEAHAGPVTCRTGETMELVCEASGDDHIR